MVSVSYEEGETIIPLLFKIIQELKNRIDETNDKEEILHNLSIFYSLLDVRYIFSYMLTRGSIPFGTNYEAEQIALKLYQILMNHASLSVIEIKETLNERPFSLDTLFWTWDPKFRRGAGIFNSMPRWRVHHPREEAPQYFYSYSHSDFFGEKIVEFFKAAFPYQIKIWVDKDDLRRHQKLPGELSTAIDNSVATILMLSKNYLKSKWCDLEWQAAIVRNLGEDPPMRLYVAVLDDCELPAFLSPFFRTNLKGFPTPESFLELLKLIKDIQQYERMH